MDAPPVSLHDKSILITGGSMGIGLACARACIDAGARVMICARGTGALAAAAVELGDDVATACADVGDPGDVDALFDAFATALGRCDGVIHCAGVYGPIGPITEVEPDAWWDALRINLFGTFLVARGAARRMRPAGGGRIVLFSGGGASGPFPNYTAYASGKAAVVRFTETIAQELSPEIEVNCVAPGFVATRLHRETLDAGTRAGGFLDKTRAELDRGGVAPEVGAAAAAFLVSDAAAGITGKFVAAPYDGYRAWPERLEELRTSDIFTLRRILPRERGMDWQ
ncbi:MAG TPA: SDR family oxidoreductase [Candidatus Elarobacter sp.]|jgi:NAD(P)-dependent dehydrogenase (short-subunit alcohol dehydrogenase family)|nr:SDR family oxidoreductase [Candidatus Elarobacter sp.]